MWRRAASRSVLRDARVSEPGASSGGDEITLYEVERIAI